MLAFNTIRLLAYVLCYTSLYTPMFIHCWASVEVLMSGGVSCKHSLRVPLF